MNDELKKRIAAINSGTVPEGYKKTKVGIVPAEWGEIKIGELCAISAGGDIEKEHCQVYKDEKYQFPVYANALTNKGLYGYSDVFKISGETVTVTGRGEIGCAIARSEKYYPIVRLLVLKPKKKTNIVFLENQINSSKICIESTGVPQLTAPQLSLLKIAIPPLPEQQKIAEILSTQDKLISLQEKKIEQLNKLKKAYLQKMFPKKGSQYPELRFQGFTDAWEQRKFSELTEIRSASRVHKDEWQSSGVPFYRSSDVMAALNGTENEKAFISEELYEKLSAVSGKLEKGDVLVTGGGSVGKPYIVPNNEPLYTKDADLLWIKNNENLDPYFVYTFFFSPTFTDYLNSVSHVGTIAHYTITQLGETPITLPCVSEQQKIGDYFRNLDFLITLHQHKLEQEKQKKKALMQLLLTGKVRVKP